MAYDHHEKAGNQGDVVKHIALIAAIDSLLSSTPQKKCFSYADTFAGYAYSPLLKDNQWTEGVQKLTEKEQELSKNPSSKLWFDWYLKGRPQLLGGIYPGSSLITSDLCRFHDTSLSMRLWDISPEVVSNLIETYWKHGHKIFTQSAVFSDAHIKEADFVFIDPPGLDSGGNKDYPVWEDLKQFFSKKPTGQSIMMWLPVNAVTTRKVGETTEKLSPPGEDEASLKACNDCVREFGSKSIRIRWANGGRTIGCYIICNLSKQSWQAVKTAIEHVVSIVEWQAKLDEKIHSIMIQE